jgi:PAS domain S-box-containing protein
MTNHRANTEYPDRRLESDGGLEHQHASFHELFDALSDGVFILDPLTALHIDHNQAATDMLGYTREESAGRRVGFTSAGAGKQSPEEAFQQMLSVRGGEPKRFEWMVTHKDGHSFRAEITMRNVVFGGTPRIIATLHDITSRKAVEERLRKTEELFRLMTENTTDLIAIDSLEGNRIYVSPSYKNVFGDSREIIGTNVLGEIHPEDRERMKGAFESVVAGKIQHEEYRYLLPDGSLRYIESSASPVRDSEGKVVNVLTVSRDVTSRRALEGQFFHAQRMESIGILAGGIAHDLNNVLAPILMSVEYLRNNLPLHSFDHILNILQSSAQRGANIVKQVLHFARGEQGERYLVQPRFLVKEVENIIRETFPKSIKITNEVTHSLTPILAEATQLHQVLLNLCVNARDAMPTGGELRISGENVDLDENYARMHPEAKPGKYVSITIADTGTGIPPEVISKIFDPFFTTKDPGKGTGLGLSSSHGIIRSHEGFIMVYSEVGKGTKFRVYLPATAEGREEEPSLPAPPGLQTGRGELILVIDDEGPICEITKTTLELYGYTALTAHDGAEGLAVFVQHRKDIRLVITDMMMPTLDGPTTIRALKRIDPAVKIIATSGVQMTKRELDNMGVADFILKPYTAPSLVSVVQQIFAPVSA